MRWIIAVTIALVCARAYALPKAPGAQSPKDSVVYVSHWFGDHGDAGTGTVVQSENGKSIVLTCAHVVEDGRAELCVYTVDGIKHRARLLAGAKVRNIGPSLIDIDGPDLAILEVDGELHAAKIATRPLRLRERVQLWGFAGRTMLQGPMHKTGTVVLEGSELRSTITTDSGDSGSGVFNEDGELVGVHCGRTFDRANARAAPLSAVKAFLVRWQKPGKERKLPKAPAAAPAGLTYAEFRAEIAKGKAGILVVGKPCSADDGTMRCRVPSGYADLADGEYKCFLHQGQPRLEPQG